ITATRAGSLPFCLPFVPFGASGRSVMSALHGRRCLLSRKENPPRGAGLPCLRPRGTLLADLLRGGLGGLARGARGLADAGGRGLDLRPGRLGLVDGSARVGGAANARHELL